MTASINAAVETELKHANLGESVKAGVTRAKMETLGAAIGQYEGEFGDYPPSSWNPDWGSEPNKTNAGAEMLFLSLFSPEFESGLAEDDLDNTDRDQAKKSLSSLGSKDLFELTDEWDNPIAYFHRRDYGREDLYVTYDPDTGEEVESRVKALNDPQTKSPFNRLTYQLISAGKDGRFGTDDDVCNFDKE